MADLILLGDVVTLDGKGTRARALAIRDGRVLASGSRQDMLAAGGDATQIVDFGDAAIIPGFNDTHAHMDTEGIKQARPSLAGARSIADVLARIQALAAERAEGAWLLTMPVGTPPYYFDGPAALAENRMPSRHELDRAAPANPVCILPPSGYWGAPPCYSALNSAALALNGIDRTTTPRLAGIEILKDADGEPTGVIADGNPRESAQLDLLPAVPGFTAEERAAGVREAMRLYHAKGTTSIYEGHGCSPEFMRIYQDLWQAGELTMRVGMVVSPAWASIQEAEAVMRDWLGPARGPGLGDATYRVSGVHIGFGGDPEAAGLARARGNDTGYWSFHWHAHTPEEFEHLCLLAARHGIRVHTIASAGNQEKILPILERVHGKFDLRGRRWVLEHLSLAREQDLRAIKAMGLGVTLIPLHHLWKNGTRLFGLSAAEEALAVPAKRLRELGVPVSAGTDNVPYDPLASMAAMILRAERTTGRVLGAAARLSAEAALETVTASGAWLTFEEDIKGRLVAGHLADCAVLSRNPLDADPQAFQDIDCLATLVGGAFVHRRA